jgi:hypothetical protein
MTAIDDMVNIFPFTFLPRKNAKAALNYLLDSSNPVPCAIDEDALHYLCDYVSCCVRPANPFNQHHSINKKHTPQTMPSTNQALVNTIGPPKMNKKRTPQTMPFINEAFVNAIGLPKKNKKRKVSEEVYEDITHLNYVPFTDRYEEVFVARGVGAKRRPPRAASCEAQEAAEKAEKA